MLAVLSRYMTGPAPEVRSGDAIERRGGFVNVGDVVDAIKLATEPQTRAIENLDRTFRRELQAQTEALTARLTSVESRIGEVEQWKDLQEDAALIRQGKMAVTLGALRFVLANHKALWPIVVGILGTLWMLTGHQPVGVGPIQP